MLLRLRGLRGHHHRAYESSNRLETFLSLSALNAFRMMSRTNIDRIRAEFSSKHKRRSHDSFTTKEYKSVRRCCRSLPSLLLLSRKVVEITFGETSSEFSSKEKSCSVALFLSSSHKWWRRLTRRTKKRERERGFYRARSHISASLVFLQKRLCASERSVFYWCVRFVSRGGCAQSTLERGEEDSFPLHKGRRRGGCDFWSHSSSARQF